MNKKVIIEEIRRPLCLYNANLLMRNISIYGDDEFMSLDEIDILDENITYLIPSNISKCWYWYIAGDFDGRGYLLCEHSEYKETFILYDMSHSSYEGPLRSLVRKVNFDDFIKLDSLEKKCAKDVLSETQVLFDLARNNIEKLT